MISEVLLLTLFCLFLLALLAMMFLWMRASAKLLKEMSGLYLSLVQLLASKDIVAYDAARRSTVSEMSYDESGPAVYYTGDALQYQNEKMEGRVSDDELTGISKFGV